MWHKSLVWIAAAIIGALIGLSLAMAQPQRLKMPLLPSVGVEITISQHKEGTVLYRILDEEFGVACYSLRVAPGLMGPKSSAALDQLTCVKVR